MEEKLHSSQKTTCTYLHVLYIQHLALTRSRLAPRYSPTQFLLQRKVATPGTTWAIIPSRPMRSCSCLGEPSVPTANVSAPGGCNHTIKGTCTQERGRAGIPEGACHRCGSKGGTGYRLPVRSEDTALVVLMTCNGCLPAPAHTGL